VSQPSLTPWDRRVRPQALALVMHSGSRLPNDMRPPSVVQFDIRTPLSPSPFAPCQAPSNVPPSRPCAGSRPHRSEHALRPRSPQSDSFCCLFPAKRASRAEPLRKTFKFHDYHAGGGSAPNSSGTFQRSRNPATPLKPDIRLVSPCVRIASTRADRLSAPSHLRSRAPTTLHTIRPT